MDRESCNPEEAHRHGNSCCPRAGRIDGCWMMSAATET
jgi:hypothetical protein